MTDEELSAEDCLEQLNTLTDELLQDREKLNRLLREGAFGRKIGDGITVATPLVGAELTQTVFSAQVDATILLNTLLQHHHDMLEALESSAYGDTPRAVRKLMEALRSDAGLTETAVVEIAGILESDGDSEEESFLAKQDGEQLMDVLAEYKSLLASLGSTGDSSVMRVDAAIAKVRQLSPALQEKESESDTDTDTEPAEETPSEESTST